MFLALKKFVTNFITAKKCLKRAIMTSDLRTKKDYFKTWYREHQFDIGCENAKNQNSNVAVIQNLRKNDGEMQNTNYESE
jgi:hypothetical protein